VDETQELAKRFLDGQELRVITGEEADAWPLTFREIPIGGYIEFPEWEIRENSLEYLGDPGIPLVDMVCKHVTEIVVVRRPRHVPGEASLYDTLHAVVPRVVFSRNEGGYNATTVCVDCILEAAELPRRGLGKAGKL
jgi:hypothetical protein